MNDLLKLHKVTGGKGTNEFIYKEYLDEHFNTGELVNVTSSENKLSVTGKTFPILTSEPYPSDLNFYINFEDGIHPQKSNAVTSCTKPVFVDGDIGKAMGFHHVDNVLHADKNDIFPTQGEFTFRMYYKMRTMITEGMFFAQNNNAGGEGQYLEVWKDKSSLALGLQTSATVTTIYEIPKTNLKINKWSELIINGKIGDSNSIMFYIDGKSFKPTSMSYSPKSYYTRNTMFGGLTYVSNANVKNMGCDVGFIEIYKSIKNPSDFEWEKEGYRISPPINLPNDIISSKINWDGEGKISLIHLLDNKIPYFSNEVTNNTFLYLHGNSLYDISNRPKNISFGKTTITENSLKLNATRDCFYSQDNPILEDEFTVEFWGRCNDLTSNKNWQSFFEINYSDASSTKKSEVRVGIRQNTSNLIVLGLESLTKTIEMGVLQIGEWHHYAITKKGNNIYGFVDGMLKGNYSTSNSPLGNKLYLGHTAYSSDLSMDCNIKEFMISNECKYTDNFIPKNNTINIKDGYYVHCTKGTPLPNTLSLPTILKQELEGEETISNVQLDVKHKPKKETIKPKDLVEDEDDSVLWLYKEGDECIDVTGGWKADQFDHSYTRGYCVKQSTYLDYGDNSTNYGYGGFVTNNPIDLTKYSKIIVDLEIYYHYRTSSYDAWNMIALCSSNDPNIRVNGSVQNTGGFKNTNARQTMELDISNINTSKHIGALGMSGAFNDHQVKCKLHSMQLR